MTFDFFLNVKKKRKHHDSQPNSQTKGPLTGSFSRSMVKGHRRGCSHGVSHMTSPVASKHVEFEAFGSPSPSFERRVCLAKFVAVPKQKIKKSDENCVLLTLLTCTLDLPSSNSKDLCREMLGLDM